MGSITFHAGLYSGIFLRLPPSCPNATIWCSMTPANLQPSAASRPRVGIPWRTSHEEANQITNKLQYYFDAVCAAEGEPVRVSLQLSGSDLASQVKDLDAFVLPGAPADVNPALYRAPRHEKTHDADPNREKTDFAILEHSFASGKPVLAICYGCQSLNVCLGGSLYQDIASELHTNIKHSKEGLAPDAPDPVHPARIKPGGEIAQLAAISGFANQNVEFDVKIFAQAGADVVFNYVKAKDAALQVQQEAAKHGTRVEAFKADVGKHAENQKLVEHTIARLGRLDILVANAGVWNPEDLPIEKMTEKQWDDMIRINLKSVYSIIHFAVPQMIKQKSGKIIPISSTAGQRGESFHTHYGASKGGIISFTKGLATELARHNILVNCVAPGWVATDMSVPVLETKAGQKMASTVIPLGRAATAEEIAGPILFVASDLANFMTGEIINVNGGSVLCG